MLALRLLHRSSGLIAAAPALQLYTSGSTGRPKGVLHTTAGYMVGAALTYKYVFDAKPETDVYWCTADAGWITGHSYVTYGRRWGGCGGLLPGRRFLGTVF